MTRDISPTSRLHGATSRAPSAASPTGAPCYSVLEPQTPNQTTLHEALMFASIKKEVSLVVAAWGAPGHVQRGPTVVQIPVRNHRQPRGFSPPVKVTGSSRKTQRSPQARFKEPVATPTRNSRSGRNPPSLSPCGELNSVGRLGRYGGRGAIVYILREDPPTAEEIGVRCGVCWPRARVSMESFSRAVEAASSGHRRSRPTLLLQIPNRTGPTYRP
jgi:hypothetical protein